jgi:hypothetical protein
MTLNSRRVGRFGRLALAASLALTPGCRRKAEAPDAGAPGEGAAAATPTPTPEAVVEALKEAELAQAITLSGTEFPGWEIETPDWGRANPFAGCGRVGGDRHRGPAETAAGISPLFYPARQERPGSWLQARVVLYPGKAQATSVLEFVPRALECRARALGEGKANIVGAHRYGAAFVEPLAAPAQGDAGAGGRLRGRARGMDMDDPEETELYWDVVALTRSRVLIIIEAHGFGAPIETPLLGQFAARALAKVDAANP